jgi:hypothetical protein
VAARVQAMSQWRFLLSHVWLWFLIDDLPDNSYLTAAI